MKQQIDVSFSSFLSKNQLKKEKTQTSATPSRPHLRRQPLIFLVASLSPSPSASASRAGFVVTGAIFSKEVLGGMRPARCPWALWARVPTAAPWLETEVCLEVAPGLEPVASFPRAMGLPAALSEAPPPHPQDDTAYLPAHGPGCPRAALSKGPGGPGDELPSVNI